MISNLLACRVRARFNAYLETCDCKSCIEERAILTEVEQLTAKNDRLTMTAVQLERERLNWLNQQPTIDQLCAVLDKITKVIADAKATHHALLPVFSGIREALRDT